MLFFNLLGISIISWPGQNKLEILKKCIPDLNAVELQICTSQKKKWGIQTTQCVFLRCVLPTVIIWNYVLHKYAKLNRCWKPLVFWDILECVYFLQLSTCVRAAWRRVRTVWYRCFLRVCLWDDAALVCVRVPYDKLACCSRLQASHWPPPKSMRINSWIQNDDVVFFTCSNSIKCTTAVYHCCLVTSMHVKGYSASIIRKDQYLRQALLKCVLCFNMLIIVLCY